MDRNDLTEEAGFRLRAKISSSTKGVLTFDCTAEGSRSTSDQERDEVRAEVLHELDLMVAELKQRCGTPEVGE